MDNYITVYALVIALAFFIGGIPFGYIVTKLFGAGDIRTQGSGNIGATNVWRMVGPIPGVLTLLLDFIKGVFVASAIPFPPYFSFLGGPLFSHLPPEFYWLTTSACFAVVLGHVYSPYLGFRGGKGVITAFGVLVSLAPYPSLVGLAVFVIVVALTRYVSLGSMVGSLALAGAVWYDYLTAPYLFIPAQAYFGSAVAMLIIYTHRQNIKRLLNGSENKFSRKKKQESS